MNLVCGPDILEATTPANTLRLVLYGQARTADRASAGAAARDEILRARLHAPPRAWDLLSLALSVVTADFASPRDKSPDGWTRELELDVKVSDPAFWSGQVPAIEKALAFLTTDIWRIRFHAGGMLPAVPNKVVCPDEDCVVLLSGGLDSLVGTIDLVTGGRRPFAVSQVVRGDAEKQVEFAGGVGGGLRHLQLNHNVTVPGADENSQRTRSLIFVTFGVMAATTLRRYHEGHVISLFVCENGFIAMNPALTGSRVGSLSTRTAHPEFLKRLQDILDSADLRVRIENPYEFKTKGEMLIECADQSLLKKYAIKSTSCGRFQFYNYKHCGRCVPCQVRRAAFMKWGVSDATPYVFKPLGRDDSDHAGFDDVRCVAMAIAEARADGVDVWLGPTLSSPLIVSHAARRELLRRGLDELTILHNRYGVK
jgi:7-cyano-7-deazaguanine synthase in queuosine biosynthesis